jgi:hypothetical protein
VKHDESNRATLSMGRPNRGRQPHPVAFVKRYGGHMRIHVRLLLAAIAASCLLASAITSASARRISMTEQGFLVRWGFFIFSSEGARVSCPVTLEGSFHSRTLSKVSGQLVGYVSRARFPGTAPPCRNGIMLALTTTLPWHIQYNSFAGTLPGITRIRIGIVGVRLELEASGISCLMTTTQANPMMLDINVNAANGEARTWSNLPEHTIPLAGPLCGFVGNGSFEETAEVFTLVIPQVRITVRLVQ